MPVSVDRLQFAPPQPPGMLRAIGFAIVAHLLLMLALTWGVNWKRESLTLAAEAELWSALPQEAAPKAVAPLPSPPVPAPSPVTAPPVPAPTPVPVKAETEPNPREAEIAVEREQEKKAQARRKQLALEREEKREAEQALAAKKKAVAEKRLEAQRELEERRKQELAKAKATEDRQKQESAKRLQAEEKRIETQRQANLDRMQGMAGATGAPSATGTALRAAGMSDSYPGRVAARVKPNIVFRDEMAGNPRAEIEVRTAPDGTIVGQRIVKSSGVRSWDEAVLNAVIKTEVLPRDVDGRVPSPLIIGFRPKD